MGINVSSEYTGKVAQEIYRDIFFGAPTIMNSYTKIYDNVKGKLRLPRLDIEESFLHRADGCDFVPVGQLDLNDRLLEVCDMDIKVQFCKKDVELLYDESGIWKQPAGANNTEIPPTLQDAIIATIVEKTTEELEEIIWRGDSDLGSGHLELCDGFLKQIDVSPDTVIIPTNTMDETTIKQILIDTFKSIPPVLFNSPRTRNKIKMFADPNVQTLIQIAMTEQNVNFPALTYKTDVEGNTVLFYHGIEIVPTNGLNANRIIVTYIDNLHIGTDLISDIETIRIIDMSASTGDDYVRMIGRMKFGTQISDEKYIASYIDTP